MPKRRPSVSVAAIGRVLPALKTAGQEVAKLELHPDGTVIVHATGGTPAVALSPLEQGRADRAARAANAKQDEAAQSTEGDAGRLRGAVRKSPPRKKSPPPSV